MRHNINWKFNFIFIGIIFLFTNSCKKDETISLPTLSTSEVSNITAISAACGGNITKDGGSVITQRGICLGITINPTIVKTSDGNGVGTFASSLSELTPGVTYHVRAYATNSIGTAYGNDISFTTLGLIPMATTTAATKITSSAATLNGTVNANGLTTTISFEYGTTTNYGSTSTESTISGNANNNVEATIGSLEVGLIYHFRIKTVNSIGTTYGDDKTFLYVFNGANYQGGIVFYIDNSGEHGLICATSDQSDGIVWGCYGTILSGAAGQIVGTGMQNTIDIVNGCSSNSAAKICYELILNDKSDWFLPSLDELKLMYNNLRNNNLGSFNGFYWSSTQYNTAAGCIDFSDYYIVAGSKLSTNKVRAVRWF